jgi:hypothetical protein
MDILKKAEAWVAARKAEGWKREDFLRELGTMMGIKAFVIWELDDDGHANGTVHWYCSAECREKDKPIINGWNEMAKVAEGQDDLPGDGSVCETCGLVL